MLGKDTAEDGVLLPFGLEALNMVVLIELHRTVAGQAGLGGSVLGFGPSLVVDLPVVCLSALSDLFSPVMAGNIGV